jgi:hypothetical protein
VLDNNGFQRVTATRFHRVRTFDVTSVRLGSPHSPRLGSRRQRRMRSRSSSAGARHLLALITCEPRWNLARWHSGLRYCGNTTPPPYWELFVHQSYSRGVFRLDRSQGAMHIQSKEKDSPGKEIQDSAMRTSSRGRLISSSGKPVHKRLLSPYDHCDLHSSQSR